MTSPHERFTRAADRFGAVLDRLGPDELGQPSRCTGWSVREVVGHVVETQRDFLAARGVEIGVLDDDPIVALGTLRATIDGSLTDPAVADLEYDGFFGPTTIAATVDRFYTLDLVVHRWDIAAALGFDDAAELDDDEIAHVTEALAEIPEAVLRSPGLFAAARNLGDSATRSERTLAFLGRG